MVLPYTVLKPMWDEVEESKVVYIGDDEDKIVYSMEKAGDYTHYGQWRNIQCAKCKQAFVPMLCFDNSGKEYDPICLCKECVKEICDTFIGGDDG